MHHHLSAMPANPARTSEPHRPRRALAQPVTAPVRQSLPLCTQVFLLPRHLAIVMEYAQGGNLFQYILRQGGPSRTPHLQESHARWLFQQLVIGMDYCHRMVRPSPRMQPEGRARRCVGRPRVPQCLGACASDPACRPRASLSARPPICALAPETQLGCSSRAQAAAQA